MALIGYCVSDKLELVVFGATYNVVFISDQLSWLSSGFLGSLRLRIPDRTRPTTTAAYA